MKSYRENPEGKENQKATRETDREIQHLKTFHSMKIQNENSDLINSLQTALDWFVEFAGKNNLDPENFYAFAEIKKAFKIVKDQEEGGV